MDRLTRIESSVSDVERALQRIEQRVASLEGTLAALHVGMVPGVADVAPPLTAGAPVEPALTAPPALQSVASVPVRQDLASVPSLVGRTFLALAGAFLLRALTDSGALPPTAGIGIGLAYAALWLVLADRAGAVTPISGVFHGLVTSFVAFPLVWEATTRFHLFTPEQSAAALAVVTAGALVVSARRKLHLVAWVASMLAVATAFAFVAATDRITPYTTFLIALGIATLWLGYVCDWVALRWPVALAANLAVLGVTVRVVSGHGVETAVAAAMMQMLLIGAYLLSIMIRTLVRGRDVIPFEVAQGIGALAVGLGGAVALTKVMTLGIAAIGLPSLLLGITCYVIAFQFIARRQGLRDNFYFYTTLGVLLVLASTTLLLDPTPLAVTRALLAVAAAWTAARFGPPLLTIHAAIYGVAAAVTAGLLPIAAYRVLGSAAGPWPPFDATMLLVVAASAICAATPVSPRARTWGPSSHVPRVALLLLVMWGGAGWIIDLLAHGLASNGAGAIDAGILATLRTCVISAAALGLAWAGGNEGFREARWLVYPVLIVGGFKLLVDDFPHSRPATLFIAFAIYGVALIFAPKLAKRAGTSG